MSLSILGTIVGRGLRMGVLASTVFMPSHTDAMDVTSIPIAAMLTSIHCPVLAPEASSLWSMLV